jgi:hypothetical protein
MEKYYFMVMKNGSLQNVEEKSKEDIQKILKDTYQYVPEEDKEYQPLEEVLKDLYLGYYNKSGQRVILYGHKLKKGCDIKTLKKIESDIYLTNNKALSNALLDYELNIKKRINDKIVETEVKKMIEVLQNVKIKAIKRGMDYGGVETQYIFFINNEAKFDAWDKHQALRDYRGLKLRIKKLLKFLEIYFPLAVKSNKNKIKKGV